MNTKRLTLSAIFVSVMMVLGYIESMIPFTALFGGAYIKLGLANSVLLLSLYWMGIPLSWLLMLVKVLLSGFLFGNPVAMQYSLAGGVLSMLAMILMIFVFRGVSPVGAGVAGAVMHNVGQVLLAVFIVDTRQLLVTYLPVLMLAGIVAGALTGTVAATLMRRLPAKFRPEPRAPRSG